MNNLQRDFLRSTEVLSFSGGSQQVHHKVLANCLYLKYLWCLGEICRPPHCPFDRMVIEELDVSGNLRTYKN